MLLATTRETCVKNRRNTAGTMQMTAFNRPHAPDMGSKRHAPLARREFCKRLGRCVISGKKIMGLGGNNFSHTAI
jgi:hypothetical protein